MYERSDQSIRGLSTFSAGSMCHILMHQTYLICGRCFVLYDRVSTGPTVAVGVPHFSYAPTLHMPPLEPPPPADARRRQGQSSPLFTLGKLTFLTPVQIVSPGRIVHPRPVPLFERRD